MCGRLPTPAAGSSVVRKMLIIHRPALTGALYAPLKHVHFAAESSAYTRNIFTRAQNYNQYSMYTHYVRAAHYYTTKTWFSFMFISCCCYCAPFARVRAYYPKIRSYEVRDGLGDIIVSGISITLRHCVLYRPKRYNAPILQPPECRGDDTGVFAENLKGARVHYAAGFKP